MVDAALQQPMDVPPPGEAGGYEHERHKQNYREMQAAGLLFTITGEEKYAQFVKNMLMKYAALYPTLGPHPMAHHQKPGRLFHQMLNETVWLTYTSMAYDCIYDWLDAKTREQFEKNIFRPIVEWFTGPNAHEFDRIHNHGTWSVCSVGMIGYVLGDKNMVDMALYGTKKNSKGGFLKQLDLLFSPDGYYMEGPYYVRYALRPFFFFAEAVQRNQPELNIYQYRNSILKKAYYSAVQTTFPNGVFPPINDASRTMDITDVGIVLANSLVFQRYGADINLLGLAKIQQEVLLNGAGLELAKAYAKQGDVPDCDWGSVEFTDGYDGKQGGLGILRMGTGDTQSMLLMKYGVHGAGHGHFDKLHFIFYDHGREVIPDYGFCRWINIEPKFGGRYLPENKSYAMQTITHNTVTVDGMTQNRFNRKEADRMSGQHHFFDANNPNVKVMSARAPGYYPGVDMQRTLFLIRDERLDMPAVLDIYRLRSDDTHTYDYPIHYRGQMMATSLKYQAQTSVLQPLGDDFGYQHIWKEAEAQTDVPFTFTWLDGHHYYTLVHAVDSPAKVMWGRTGANDPNFNLISEPLVIVRTKAANHVFASVIEAHGYFNEAKEQSQNARGIIQQVKVVGDTNEGIVVEVSGKNGLKWRVMVTNQPANADAKRSLMINGQTYHWTGNYRVNLHAR